jgi:RNA polymerase primary sigma factor
MIRLPHRKEEILRKIQHSYHILSQKYSRQPKAEEIAVEIGVSKEDVEFILSVAHDIIPFDLEKRDGEYTSAIELHEDYTYSPERALIKKSSREATLQVLNHLKAREKRILVYRYQLYGEKGETLKNIGDKMGLSTETVRQIELKALQKLRGQAEDLRAYIGAV